MDHIEKLQAEVKTAIEGMDDQVKSFIEESAKSAESQTKLGKRHAEQMKELEEKSAEVMDRLLDIEQKQSARNEGQEVEAKSAGMQFVESEEYASFQKGGNKRARLEMKNTIVGADATVAPDRLSGVIGGAFRTLRISDAIPQGNTVSNAVEYTRESTFVNNAAETAEGAAKPESDVTFELVNQPVQTIAHWIKLTKQVIDDAPMLASYVDTRMRYGVELRLDNQLVNGDGTTPNISGMLDTGNYTVFTPTGTDASVSIRQAQTQVLLADYAPTAVILNPADCQAIDLTTGTDGHYVAADPRAMSTKMIWGMPIIESNAMTAGQFLVAAFPVAYQQWNRQGVTVDLSESDDTNFQTNLVTLRAEMRAMLASYRPASAVGGALSV